MGTDELTTNSEEFAIPVFWTGGVDSTFRVLDLAIHYGCAVQPIYVRDPKRRSVNNELDAIQRIHDRVISDFPETAEHLRDLLVLERDEIPSDPTITEKYNTLRSTEEVSWQYEWLANVPAVTGFGKIELGVKGITPLFRLLKEHSVERQYPCGATTYDLTTWDYSSPYEEAASLFQNFSFPILHIDKAELEHSAEEHRFADILKMSWFCHYPWGDQPCGACSVCRSFLGDNELLSFSTGVRLRNKIWFVIHPARLLLGNPQAFMHRIRDNFNWRQRRA